MRKGIWFVGFVVLSTLTVLPLAVLFPPQIRAPGHTYDITFALLGLVVIFDLTMLTLAGLAEEDVRKHCLKSVAWIAGIGIAASFLLRVDILVPVIAIPTPHLLAPALGVDGESAYDADVFEIYCELWLIVAALLASGALAWRRLKRGRS